MLKGFCFCFLLPPSFHVQIFSKIPNYSSDPESVSRQQNATKQNKKDQVKEREQQAWKRQAITWNYSQREGRKKKEKKKKYTATMVTTPDYSQRLWRQRKPHSTKSRTNTAFGASMETSCPPEKQADIVILLLLP